MLTSYPSRDAFAAALDERLSRLSIETAVRVAVVTGILRADDEVRALPRTDSDLSLRVGGWFLRAEDVPFVESIGVVGALAAGLAAGGALVPAVIATVTSSAAVAWRIWRRGGHITHQQLLTLTLLREHGPTDRATLLMLLEEQKQAMSPRELDDLLSELQNVELTDGSVVSLVRTLGERYRAVKI